ncbi:MAG: diguanylate cyclase [Desulfuromonadales bacterium]|nr:diguanylate cyclase [Desulfuromonadales bacterium]
MHKILVVEDDRFFRDLFADLLTGQGYDVNSASSGQEGLKMLADHSYDLVVTDLVMPDVDGMEILAKAREIDPSIDIIMVTGNANMESAIFALKHGARDYIVKPINSEEFLHSVAQCLEQRRILDENEELKSMLNLYQSSQTIAGCLDIERLYHLVPDAFAREIGVSRSMGLFLTENALELCEAKGVSDSIAEHYTGVIQACIAKNILGTRLMMRIQFSDKSAAVSGINEAGIEEAHLIFMRSRGTLQGVIVVFNEPGLRLPELNSKNKNILFLLEQSLLALENANSFALAKDMLFIDDLSGLYNQRYLEVALDREMKRSGRFSSQLAILFLDMDAFKQVNDMHGHLVGSRVLKEMGKLLRTSVRDVDVVIRYGGDEYTLILVETSPDVAALVAERIRAMVESHEFLSSEGYNIRMTCSVGFSCCPDDALTKDELLEMADQAMYAGKGRGKNCVTRFQKTS